MNGHSHSHEDYYEAPANLRKMVIDAVCGQNDRKTVIVGKLANAQQIEQIAELAGTPVIAHCTICGESGALVKNEQDGLLYCVDTRACLERRAKQIVETNSRCPNGGARSLCPIVRNMDDPRETCAKCGRRDRNGLTESEREYARNYEARP